MCIHTIARLLRRKHAPSIGCVDKELTPVIASPLRGYLTAFLRVSPPPVAASTGRLSGVLLLSPPRSSMCRFSFSSSSFFFSVLCYHSFPLASLLPFFFFWFVQIAAGLKETCTTTKVKSRRAKEGEKKKPRNQLCL